MLKILKGIGFIICVLISLWFIISYIDVLIYQFNGGTNHTWNFIKIFSE